MAHVLLTVGTNPLPILVAARRLLLAGFARGADLTLIHSPETEQEAERILQTLRAQLSLPGIPGTWHLHKLPIATEPKSIFESVVGYLSTLPPNQAFHLHYTGGTKAMGLHTLEALLVVSSGSIEKSYLDPNGNILIDDSGQMVDPGVTDERITWNMDLPTVAALHGFTLSFNLFRYGQLYSLVWGPHVPGVTILPNPQQFVDEPWLEIVRALRPGFKTSNAHRAFFPNSDFWASEKRWPQRFVPSPHTKGFEWPAETAWRNIPDMINQYFAANVFAASGTTYKYDPNVLSSQQSERLHGLLNNGWLELMAYDALRTVLTAIGRPFYICPSAHVGRGRNGQMLKDDFELDVAVVLGYQLLVVSCTTSVEPKLLKGKGFEVIHRARQIGGDGARAIVLSLAPANTAKLVQNQLHDDIGTREPPLTIWGWDDFQVLEARCREYLHKKLTWHKPFF